MQRSKPEMTNELRLGPITQAVPSARLKDFLSDDLRFFPTGGTA